jgi:hypothetical protein
LSITFDQTGIGNDFSGNLLTIDGNSYNKNSLPITFKWNQGSTHNFAFDAQLALEGKRYEWTNTLGLSTNQNGTITATTSGTITGRYNSLYYLNVVSSYGNPQGQGWYKPNATAIFSVSSPVDHENRTLRVFLQWKGDTTVFEPTGTLVMNKPSTVTAIWETQYLVTFNTTLPNLTTLNVPGIPTTLPPELTVFGAYYPANQNLTAGPAPTTVTDTNKTRYVLSGWTLDDNPFAKTPDFSLIVDAPHNLGVVYGTGHLLTINAIGITDKFTASVKIDSNPTITRILSPTTSIEEWLIQNAPTKTTVSTVNTIGHGDWAIFKFWTGQIQQETNTVSFTMSAPITLNAVFFKANPVAESIPYSLMAGIATTLILSLFNRKKPAKESKNQRSIWTAVGITIVSMIVAVVVSSMAAIGYGINMTKLLDFTNWAVIVTAIEAIIFLTAATIITKKIQPNPSVQKL